MKETLNWSHSDSLERLMEKMQEVRALCPDLPLQALRWMHMRHPIHPVQKELLSHQKLKTGNFPQLLRRMLTCVAYGIYFTFLVFRLRWAVRDKIGKLRREKFDFVAKSWSFGADSGSDGNDFYFGDLQSRLSERQMNLLMLSSDVRGGSPIRFAQSYTSLSGTKISELCLVPLSAPIQMVFKQLVTSVRLLRAAQKIQDPLVQEICHRASQDCLLSSVFREGLLFWVGLRAVQWWRPKAFVTLYEGLGWEKCIWSGVKSVDASCHIVGYQHTVLFPESLSLTAPKKRMKTDIVPDVVLCLGEIPLELMRKGHEPYGVRMFPFGSFRFQNSQPVGCYADPVRRTVLVTPEGIASEVKILFSFALRCAKLLPDVTFILRSHPEIPMEKAVRLIEGSIENQPNILISSEKNIHRDFEKSSVLMYRGSSAVTYAVSKGLLPIYIHVDGTLVSDPLYLLHSWRKICSTPQEFAGLLTWFEQVSSHELELEWSLATRFVSDYTVSVRKEGIDRFLESVGLPAGSLS